MSIYRVFVGCAFVGLGGCAASGPKPVWPAPNVTPAPTELVPQLSWPTDGKVIRAGTPASRGIKQPFMRFATKTSPPPYGFVEFCKKYEHLICRPTNPWDPSQIHYDTRNAKIISEQNTTSNAAISPETDLKIWGVEERWSIPHLRGDCEDYVILKMIQLIAKGYSHKAMTIAVVKDEAGEGHAVLLLHTDRGDFVLDNKTDEIKRWDQTPYIYVMAHRFGQPQQWNFISPD